MAAIYKRELRSYFTSPMGYVFIAFLVFVVSVYFAIYSLIGSYPWFGSVLSGTTFVFLILVPILTMRVMAEERRQKTDQLLMTAPVRIIDVVLGKYLALLTVFAIPMVFFCAYPLLMLVFGKSTGSLAMDYLGILGYFLLGASNLAIGLFISTLTESQVLSAVLSFLALLICYFSSSLAALIPSSVNASLVTFTVLILLLGVVLYVLIRNIFVAAGAACAAEIVLVLIFAVNEKALEGAVAQFFGIFDLSARIENFVYGIFDLNGIVYYLSAIVLFVFLTVQAIQKRRWS